MIPKNLKQALNNDFVVKEIRYPEEKRVLIVCCRRFPTCGTDNFASFWINKKYFIRNYPIISAKFGL